jgi:methionyl-tRNA formyltransferase
MIGEPLLNAGRLGALNIHGSMLPRYRGRAPVNWAILHGEKETGATLHYMSARADAGDIVDQLAVPILCVPLRRLSRVLLDRSTASAG